MKQRDDVNATRRRLLGQLPVLPLAAGMGGLALPAGAQQPAAATALPRKSEFDFTGVNLNAAFTHPMSNASVKAMHAYLDGRQLNRRGLGQNMPAERNESLALFAKLINAEPAELTWIPSTSVGENMVVAGLDLFDRGGRVVSDAYHFEGSHYLYRELAAKGVDFHVLPPRDNGIDLAQMDAAITPGTRLVAVSLVSSINGFEHDLKALCALAHSRGALVYADIIQAAGAVPIDVRASGVDFCACSTYKWLMGDFGIGFLYVRKDRLDLLKRSQYGYRQMASYETHVFPFDPLGPGIFSHRADPGMGGRFLVGTLGAAAVAALLPSLRMLTEIGVERIQAHRQPLLARLQAEMPRLGFRPMTRLSSTAPIISFSCQDAKRRLQPRLDAAGINIQLYPHRVRISPSFYNDMGDIDKLLAALA